ncbi:MAG: tRNA pseudouridine(55) synthase TruB [Bacteroidia bacterium]
MLTRQTPGTYIFEIDNGEVMLVDKPEGWTSFDVVNKIRYRVPFKKVGHAGTLDPLATGLLIVCAGKMTRQIHTFQGLEKVYSGTIILGAETPSFDRETEVSREFPVAHIAEADIIAAARAMEGTLMQQPPDFSALQQGGQRAYKRARKGEAVALQPREVHVEYFSITDVKMPEVHFEVKCSKGTYIRALARDLGRNLQSGGYLGSLRRTAIGEHTVDEALSIEALAPRLEAWSEQTRIMHEQSEGD